MGVAAKMFLGGVGGMVIVGGALFSMVSASNASIMAGSRVALSMAQLGHLPKKVGAVDKIDYYIRGDYVGYSIDRERDQKLRGQLTERQVATVERKARRVIDQFYAS